MSHRLATCLLAREEHNLSFAPSYILHILFFHVSCSSSFHFFCSVDKIDLRILIVAQQLIFSHHVTDIFT